MNHMHKKHGSNYAKAYFKQIGQINDKVLKAAKK